MGAGEAPSPEPARGEELTLLPTAPEPSLDTSSSYSVRSQGCGLDLGGKREEDPEQDARCPENPSGAKARQLGRYRAELA